MLRKLVLVLLLANLLFFTWSQGWLDTLVPFKSTGDREPERLARQVRPELVRILPPSAASAPANAAPPVPLACLEAGPFGVEAVGAAEAVLLGALGGVRWANLKSEKPGSWLIHMGRFANREAMLTKAAELARIRIAYEELRSPGEFAPGLALGRFDERGAADRALDTLNSRGIRTAKVVQLAPPVPVHMLRVDKADPALVAELAALKSDALGKGFMPCVNGTGGTAGTNGSGATGASAPR